MEHWSNSYITQGRLISEVDAVVYDNSVLAEAELRAAWNAIAHARPCSARSHLSVVYVPACGTGRHVALLAKEGHTVTASDFSAFFLSQAAQRTKCLSPNPLYFCLDMRTQLPPSLTRRFDYCMFLGGSFGYFDDEGNLAVLKHARASLKPGGVLAFDATTPQHAIRLAAQKRSSEEVVTPTFGSVLDVRDREWRPRTSSMRSRKRHIGLSTNRVLLDVTYDIKVYAHEDLRKLLAEAGFVNMVCESMRAPGGGLMDGRHMIAARAES